MQPFSRVSSSSLLKFEAVPGFLMAGNDSFRATTSWGGRLRLRKIFVQVPTTHTQHFSPNHHYHYQPSSTCLPSQSTSLSSVSVASRHARLLSWRVLSGKSSSVPCW